jgi:hypothetical protein
VSQGAWVLQHPHDNMEIISIPLEGDLEHHQDSMGNMTVTKQVIYKWWVRVQVYFIVSNKNKDQPVKFYKFYLSKSKNVTLDTIKFTLNLEDRHNKLQQILSPNQEDEGVCIPRYLVSYGHLRNFETTM